MWYWPQSFGQCETRDWCNWKKIMTLRDKYVTLTTKLPALWEKVCIYSDILRHCKKMFYFPSQNFWHFEIILQSIPQKCWHRETTLWLRPQFFRVMCDQIVTHSANFLTLWDKLVILATNFSVMWDKTVLHLTNSSTPW